MKYARLLLWAGTVMCLQTTMHAQQGSTAEDQQRQTEIREIRRELQALSARLDALEHPALPAPAATPADVPATAAESTSRPAPVESAAPPAPAAETASASPSAAAPTSSAPAAETAALASLHGTTLNFAFDGYISHNFNHPFARVNVLRAYDVSSDSFSINQATVMLERLPTPAERFGGRLDLQFGQATESLQGSAANELRPQVWRNLYRAYGSYLAPLGTGLSLDFGKWASPLGFESNYTKDDFLYSRSMSFLFLPSYHMGLRATYNLTPQLTLQYGLVNGINQTEDFNGSKSQLFSIVYAPSPKLSWTNNYFFGRESADVVPVLNPGVPSSGQPGQPASSITPAPNGREHIFDSFVSWTATPRLTLVGQADFIVQRTWAEQRPARAAIGVLRAKFDLRADWSVAGRLEYFDDRGGLFSGTSAALKEAAFAFNRQLAPGFLARAEYRRDLANQPLFRTDTDGVLTRSQDTAELGLVFWWGGKQGAW